VILAADARWSYASEGSRSGSHALLLLQYLSQPISIHRRHPKLLRQPMVHIRADNSPDAGDELEEFSEVDVVAVFLLEVSPIELVDVVREFFADALPVLHDSKDLTAASLAGKGQLENVQE